MVRESHSEPTQRDLLTGVAAELAAVGFGDAVEIGRGGFGVVYRCHEHSLDRLVAVKLLMSEVRGSEREQFVREQRALGRLSGHPHILQILHADITATRRPYLVMRPTTLTAHWNSCCARTDRCIGRKCCRSV